MIASWVSAESAEKMGGAWASEPRLSSGTTGWVTGNKSFVQDAR